MTQKKYQDFSDRLIDAMKQHGYTKSNSPNGICIEALSKIAEVSEQICRRYVRGDALPDYERIMHISARLKVSPGWLLFGELPRSTPHDSDVIDDDLMHHIISKSFVLHHQNCNIDISDCADFIVGLIRELREIATTSKENLEKIVNLALGSVNFYKARSVKMSLNR